MGVYVTSTLMFCSWSLSKSWNCSGRTLLTYPPSRSNTVTGAWTCSTVIGIVSPVDSTGGGCCVWGGRSVELPTVRRQASVRKLACYSCRAAVCALWPRSNSSTCGANSTIASNDSTAPLGEPGRLTIKTRPRVPTTERESAASGVASRPRARINSAMPGISRSRTARVASGVTSRGATPVPPVVKIAEIRPPSAKVAKRLAISAGSSGMTSNTETFQPSCSSRSRTAGPERSVRVPAVTESLMVKTAALIMFPSGCGCAADPRAPKVAALPPGFLKQVKILDFDRLIERFDHIVNRQRGYGGRGHRLHFHAGLAGGGGAGHDAHASFFHRNLHVRVSNNH